MDDDKPNQTPERLLAQIPPPLDFGGEVYYAFDYLPENKRRNDEIYKRAIQRAARKRS